MLARSIWAVVAGLLLAVLASTLIDLVFHAVGVFPSPPEPLSSNGALLATSYRVLIGIASAWLTARLAPNKPMQHALILGAVGAAIALVGAIVTWKSNLGPRWYAVALVILALPQSWLGAKIYEIQSSPRVQRA